MHVRRDTETGSRGKARRAPRRPSGRIAEAPTPKAAGAIGRTPGLGIDSGWNAQRVDVMRWVLRMKREVDRAGIDAVLAATGDRPFVEVSTRDPCWGARPVANRYEGRNVLGRLWMELRRQLRENDPADSSGAWTGRLRVGCLAGTTGGLDAGRAAV